jgi:antitoxin FitA
LSTDVAPVALIRMLWRHCGATVSDMPTIQVKNVPEDVHRTLRARAAAKGQSLQAYLLARLIDDAHEESVNAWLDRIEQHSGGSLPSELAVQLIREDRDSR